MCRTDIFPKLHNSVGPFSSYWGTQLCQPRSEKNLKKNPLQCTSICDSADSNFTLMWSKQFWILDNCMGFWRHHLTVLDLCCSPNHSRNEDENSSMHSAHKWLLRNDNTPAWFQLDNYIYFVFVFQILLFHLNMEIDPSFLVQKNEQNCCTCYYLDPTIFFSSDRDSVLKGCLELLILAINMSMVSWFKNVLWISSI